MRIYNCKRRNRSNIKKIVFLLLIVLQINLLGAVYRPNVLASDEVKKQTQIDELLTKRAELICLEEYENIEHINEKLEELGVEQLTPEEVNAKFIRNTEMVPYAYVPTASNVTWSSVESECHYLNKTYTVQILIAQANEKDSNLKSKGRRIVGNAYNMKAGAECALEVLTYNTLSDVAGNIPGMSLSLTILEMSKAFMEGYSGETEVSCEEPVYDYLHVTTAKFYYVKPGGASDDSQRLSYITTMGVTSVGCQWGQFISSNGQIIPEIIQNKKTVTTVPMGYSSEYNAAKAYVNGTKDLSCVSHVEIKGLKKQSVFDVYFLPPVSPSSIG